MAADGDGDGDGEKSYWFRFMDVARYAVALVVTALIVTVIVKAIKVVLRPSPLLLSVDRGTVFMTRDHHESPPHLVFYLNLIMYNPNSRASMYFVGVTVYLFDKDMPASSQNPTKDSFIYFPIEDTEVMPHGIGVHYNLLVNGTRGVVTPSVFDTLMRKGAMSDVTMRVEGSLMTQVSFTAVNKTHPVTYYCSPLLVGGDQDDAASKNRQEVPCMEKGPNHSIY
ncbi:hypothetical protein ACP4OV_017309 [Aristida adscensionis]